MDEKLINKLKKIKALAENGIGGEKEAAARIYENLLNMLDVSPEELDYITQETRDFYFTFSNSMEERLLGQIAYKVIGDGTYYLKPNGKKMRIVCTELESAEIQMLFNLYRKKLKEDLIIFYKAFIHRQQIFPDETARLYKEPKYQSDKSDEAEKVMKMMAGIERITPPRAAITHKFFN